MYNLARLPDKCFKLHSIESSNVTIQKKKGDMPYCNRYSVAVDFIGLENFIVNL